MARIAAFGLALAPPPGWEAVIFRRPAGAGERTYPVLHASTVPLPALRERGDYGSGIVERLRRDDVFVGLLEFDPASAGGGLFEPEGVPRLAPDAFGPRRLQRLIAGQAGAQRFFSVRGRAFCLYAVVGSYARRALLVPRVAALVSGLEIAAGERAEGAAR